MRECVDSKKLLKKQERKGQWPGILRQGGGSGQRDKDPERGWDNRLGGFDMGSLCLPQHWKVCCQRGRDGQKPGQMNPSPSFSGGASLIICLFLGDLRTSRKDDIKCGHWKKNNNAPNTFKMCKNIEMAQENFWCLRWPSPLPIPFQSQTSAITAFILFLATLGEIKLWWNQVNNVLVLSSRHSYLP